MLRSLGLVSSGVRRCVSDGTAGFVGDGLLIFEGRGGS